MSLLLKRLPTLATSSVVTEQQPLFQRFMCALPSWLPQLLRPRSNASATPIMVTPSPSPAWQEALWLAVPKKKVTRSKKRMKTTVQKRIKARTDIVQDPRTGERTLRHKMPNNWKDFLPKVE